MTPAIGRQETPFVMRLLRAEAVLFLPSLKESPLPAKTIEATPKTTASITARPTMNTVALPTHITLAAALLNMLYSRSALGESTRRVRSQCIEADVSTNRIGPHLSRAPEKLRCDGAPLEPPVPLAGDGVGAPRQAEVIGDQVPPLHQVVLRRED
jgi:hypothetical protein